ncbi:MAG: hypothetical protein R3B99_29800 [Polyangiales bacterium]
MSNDGPGILQNDAARDSLAYAAVQLGDRLWEMSGAPPDRFLAERVAGVIAAWTRFARDSFVDPRYVAFRPLAAATRPFLPPTATETLSALDAYLAGDAPFVRWSVLPPRLANIFYGADADRLSRAERGWAEAPAGVFRLSGARAIVQELADEAVIVLDEDFDTPESCADPRRKASGIGKLALLLVLDTIHVDPACFVRWRDVWHAGRRTPTDPLDEAFDLALDDAFAYGIERFSR